MSVNIDIKYKGLTNQEKWSKVKQGDYIIIATDVYAEPGFLEGLYRIFFSTPEPNQKMAVFCPMYPVNPNDDGIYPFIVPYNDNLPRIEGIVHSININVEVTT
jgi:hypothetical protein